MKNNTSNAPSGDVPIPSAPRGPSRNIDRVFFLLQSTHHTIHPLRFFTRHALLLFITSVLLIPTALSTPEYAWAIDQDPTEDPTPRVALPVITPEHWDETLVSILENEVLVHNVTNSQWVEQIDSYINMVKHIESDGKRTAYNPSGAMSYFQFKDASIQTAHNRLINYMRNNNLGEVPRWSVGLYYNPDTIYNVPADKQAVLMIINIIEQDRERGTNYFADLLSGDLQAGIDAYYKYHHTNPDPFTITRTERLFAVHFED